MGFNGTIHLLNLRDDYSKIEPFYHFYHELPEFLKDVLNLNNQFLIWYKTEFPVNYNILNHVHNIVDIYYDYEEKLLSLDDIHRIIKDINEKPLMVCLENLYKQIEDIINNKSLKFISNDELIKRKYKKVHDIFYEISKSKIKSDDINNIFSDILDKINQFQSNDLEGISKLQYIYSPKRWYFKNYIHHLRNIYLGIRYYLQKDYMLNTFDSKNIFNCDKYFCYAKDEDNNLLMGLIVNRYKHETTNEYLQEHIFISNNIKMEFSNKSKVSNLSLQLHKAGAQIEPKAKQIYCNPLTSMLSILQKAHDQKIIKLNILSKDERSYIDNLKISCFKFIPTVSIEFI